MKYKFLGAHLNAAIISAELAGDTLVHDGLMLIRAELIEAAEVSGGKPFWNAQVDPTAWRECIAATANNAEDDVYRVWDKVTRHALDALNG